MPHLNVVEAEANLRELGYRYNQAGQLRSVVGDEPFKFVNQACRLAPRSALHLHAPGQHASSLGAGDGKGTRL